MFRADRKTLDLKPNESNSAAKRLMFFIVDLVDDQDHGLLRFAQDPSELFIDRRQTFFASTTKSKRSLSQNASSAARRTCAVSSASPAPKIPPVSHRTKGRVAARANRGNPVSRNSGLVVDNSNFSADQTIEQGRLAHVRPANDCNGGQR